MVANVGPADWNFDETMSTLRYANRAKNIQNKPRINEDPKDAMLREFQVRCGARLCPPILLLLQKLIIGQVCRVREQVALVRIVGAHCFIWPRSLLVC
jgi:hypothetical protein